MATTTEAILRAHRLFSNTDEESTIALAGSATRSGYLSDTVVAEEGAPAEHLHLVISGHVELFTHLGRRETAISIIRPNAVFFIAAVMRDEAQPLSARTIGRTHLIKIPAGELRAQAAQGGADYRTPDGGHSALLVVVSGRRVEPHGGLV